MSEILPGSGIDVTGIDPGVVERGRSVKCCRCGDSPVEKPSIDGTMFASYYTPATGARARKVLCGECAFGLMEYLEPETAADPLYQTTKAEIIAAWGVMR